MAVEQNKVMNKVIQDMDPEDHWVVYVRGVERAMMIPNLLRILL
jgi:hypothetical protein